MKKLLTLALLLAVAASAAAADRNPRKKKRNRRKAKTEQVAAPAPAPDTAKPAEEEKPAEAVPVAEEEPLNDLTLGLSAEQADSLVAVWRERQQADSFTEFFDRFVLEDSTAVADAPATDAATDSLYAGRLRALVSPIPLPYNYIVKGYINRYVNPRYGTIGRILGSSQYYFPMIEDELLKENLPIELRALPIIESALSPTAVSPVGAVGLWQFMPSTGKSYGLEVNSLVDERRDPVRATQAACRYLKDLYAIYNDWTLAIAAYNCGPGNVNKALARPSSAPPMPTPTTASTTSNPSRLRSPCRSIRSASTACCTCNRSPRRSTCRWRPCGCSIRNTSWTSSPLRSKATRWYCRSAASRSTSPTKRRSWPRTPCTSRSTSTRPTSKRNASSAAARSMS